MNSISLVKKIIYYASIIFSLIYHGSFLGVLVLMIITLALGWNAKKITKNNNYIILPVLVAIFNIFLMFAAYYYAAAVHGYV